MNKLTPALVATLLCLPAFAQDKAPAAAAPAAPVAEMPKSTCVQPVSVSPTAPEPEQKKFQDALDTMRSCLIAFNAQMKAEADARVKAANKAAEDYNAFIKQISDERNEFDKKEKLKAERAERAKKQ
jgi:hypothetical protein